MTKPTTPCTTRTAGLAITEALQQAFHHYDAGQTAEAEVLLRQVLQAAPRHGGALHLLGVIAHQAGNTEMATQLIAQAIQFQPGVAQYHANLGEMYRLLKRLDDAVVHGEKAVTLNPKLASGHSNLGIAYYDQGALDRAERCQQRALALDQKMVPALNNMGSIRRDQKDIEGAINYYQQVLTLAPGYLESISNLGAVLTEAERPGEAIRVLIRAIQAKPDYAEAHCNIATAFLAMEQLDKAVAGFSRALALRPDYPEACIGMARVYQEQKILDKAEAMAVKALNMTSKKAEALSLLGGIYTEQGYPEKAEDAYANALRLKPELISAYLGRGHLRMEQGKMADAEADFLDAIKLDCSNLVARFSLTQVKKVTEDDPNFVALIIKAEKLGAMPETKAIPLHFALGKSYDDTRQYDLAFQHYFEGCRLKRRRTDYSADNNDLVRRNICEFFSRENIERLRGEACLSKLPVFVLGMPRSGTTLTEQIIASHPQVHGAGELPDLLALANRSHGRDVTAGYPLSVKGITRAELKIMGEQYVAGLQDRAPLAKRITDKMPANYNCLGLIHLMLPNAKIIHVKRNPVDTCLSCFTRLFNKSQYQSYDLKELGRYYCNYSRIMDHWHEVLPRGSFYEVQYEDLVTDTEEQAKALLAYCGLGWDARCLAFHKTERNIRTASIAQVRQPIYQTSIARWRNYEKYLADLLAALGDIVAKRG